MGKEGYIVKLKSITLEAQNPEDTKGRRSIYENGTIRIRKSTDQLQKWIITDICYKRPVRYLSKTRLQIAVCTLEIFCPC